MNNLGRTSAVAILLLTAAGPAWAGEKISKTFRGIQVLDLHMVSGDVVLEARRGRTVTVDLTYNYSYDCFEPVMERRGDELILEEDFHGRNCSGHSTWRLTVPANLDIQYSAASGDLSITGLSGSFELSSASGDMTIKDSKGEFEIDNASGRIVIAQSSGEFEIDNASGRITLEEVRGEIELDNASGRVRIDQATGRFDVNNASGDIDARGLQIDHRSSFSTASGDIEISLAHSLTYDLTLSSASGDALLNYGGNPVIGSFEFEAREGRGRITAPYPFDSEEMFDDGGRSRRRGYTTVRKIFTRDADQPRVVLKTVSGKVELRDK